MDVRTHARTHTHSHMHARTHTHTHTHTSRISCNLKNAVVHVDRNIKVNFRHNLVEVKHEKSEAIFELLDSKDGKTVTFKVGSFGAISGRQSLLRLVHAGLLQGDSHF